MNDRPGCFGISLLTCLLGCLVWLPLPSLFAQNDSLSEIPADTSRLRISSLFALPIVYYTPETRFGFGVAGLLAFRLPHEPESSRSSLLQGGVVYTQEKQLLTYISYVLYARREKFWSYGEVGYYRYSYFYYGNGNADPLPEGEVYDVNFPRLRLHLLKRTGKNWYTGLHYWLDSYEVNNVATGGLLADTLRPILGRSGGTTSGPGIISVLDKREDFYAPRSGYYLEALFQVNAPWTGSDFRFTRTTLDARVFLAPFPAYKHTLALQGFADLTTGAPPFQALALLGGSKRTRGYYEGRYRSNNLISVQAEYRMPLFWRIGITGFASTGMVFDSGKEISTRILRSSYGGGLRIRISNRDRINLRIDAAFGGQQPAFYLTIGEAF